MELVFQEANINLWQITKDMERLAITEVLKIQKIELNRRLKDFDIQNLRKMKMFRKTHLTKSITTKMLINQTLPHWETVFKENLIQRKDRIRIRNLNKRVL